MSHADGDVCSSVPITSQPAGASHRIRVWLRSLVSLQNPPPQYAIPFNDSYIYQRIWKTDTFKVGARLDFESLGGKLIMGFAASGGPQTIVMANPPRELSARSLYEEKTSTNGVDF